MGLVWYRSLSTYCSCTLVGPVPQKLGDTVHGSVISQVFIGLEECRGIIVVYEAVTSKRELPNYFVTA